ncbi:MAG: TIGR02647 family protein [Gammaproteobacteria bacterium]|nr:TIGR02647 family protein [Gammaproteobacteria bacterium]
MAVDNQLLEEIKVLVLFPTDSLQEGLKVHSNASTDAIAATERLFNKGIISQPDGGYLTDLGIELANHTHHLLSALSE